jgi:peptidoglycan/LPS O-acetylase OafA/YrhL
MTSPEATSATRSPEAAAGPRRWIPGLDGIRAVAFLLVFFVHLPPPFLPKPQGGYAGVDLFFVLSGFLITDILVRELRDRGRINFKRFFGRRAARLFPVVVLFVALIFVVTAIDDTYRSGGPQDLADVRRHGLLSLTYVYNWISIHATNRGENLFFVGPLWSLSVEEQFYVVWPLALAAFGWFARRRGRMQTRTLIWVAVAGVVLSNLLRFFIGVVLESETSYERALWGTDVNAGALLLGAVLAMVRLTEPGWYERFRRTLPMLLWPALAAMVLVVFALPEAPSTLPFAGGLLVFHLACVVVIAAVTERTAPWLNLPLELRPVRWIGKISYGAYVFHFFLVVRFQNSVRYPTPIILMYSLAVAAISFYLIEKPAGRLIRKRFKLD